MGKSLRILKLIIIIKKKIIIIIIEEKPLLMIKMTQKSQNQRTTEGLGLEGT